MRVLHFNLYGSDVGGVEGYIGDVTRALAAAGHESRLLSFAAEDPGRLMPGAVQISGARTEDVLAGIDRAIADLHPDVAYIHAVYEPALVQWIADRLPTVAYVHGPYLVCPGNALFLRRSGRACPYSAGVGCLFRAQTERCCFGRNPIRHWQRLDQVRSFVATYRGLRVLVGSRFMRELLQRNHLPGTQISVLAPFLVEAPPPEVIAVPDHTAIMYAGRITPEKGLSHLIRALSFIPQTWRLVVAGDGEDRTNCQSLAQKLGVADRTKFVGWIGKSGLSRLYQGSGFAVIPSLWPEPFGRIGPEAATYGRAAIAYDTGGVSDWLVDGVTGYLVPPGDPRLLSERISSLLDSPARQGEMGHQARALALARWSGVEHVEQLRRHLTTAQRSNARQMTGG